MPPTGLPPPPAGHSLKDIQWGKLWGEIPWGEIYNGTISVLWHVYGLVMPAAFLFNLAGTLSAAGVILYANSTMATDHALNKLFGNRESEHSIIKFPAAFLVFGVLFLFAGFAIGIALFYGLLVRPSPVLPQHTSWRRAPGCHVLCCTVAAPSLLLSFLVPS